MSKPIKQAKLMPKNGYIEIEDEQGNRVYKKIESEERIESIENAIDVMIGLKEGENSER